MSGLLQAKQSVNTKRAHKKTNSNEGSQGLNTCAPNTAQKPAEEQASWDSSHTGVVTVAAAKQAVSGNRNHRSAVEPPRVPSARKFTEGNRVKMNLLLPHTKTCDVYPVLLKTKNQIVMAGHAKTAL